ncbi:hypothetical protein [Caulobacter sp. SSI4214]|uniref:hypothetical protein n=1 Tax=Caulobacter sp. SSI4214 TaxID=2575739 RepID=UPI001439ACA4|nr:hypothetical protein [Caulobacter sp. SSI4214]
MLVPVDFTAASQRLSLVPDAECDTGPSQLSQGAYRALRQLERRLRTGGLDAVNIRHAQELAALGLAHHDRGGWRPTSEGLNYLGRRPDRNGPD